MLPELYGTAAVGHVLYLEANRLRRRLGANEPGNEYRRYIEAVSYGMQTKHYNQVQASKYEMDATVGTHAFRLHSLHPYGMAMAIQLISAGLSPSRVRSRPGAQTDMVGASRVANAHAMVDRHGTPDRDLVLWATRAEQKPVLE